MGRRSPLELLCTPVSTLFQSCLNTVETAICFRNFGKFSVVRITLKTFKLKKNIRIILNYEMWNFL